MYYAYIFRFWQAYSHLAEEMWGRIRLWVDFYQGRKIA